MSSSTMSRLKGGVVRRTGLTVGLALAALAAVPALASASSVSENATTVTFTGTSSSENVTVTVNGSNYRFSQTSGTLTASTGCSSVNSTTADCPIGSPPRSVLANLGDGDDVFNASTVNQGPFTINGEAGDDGNIQGSQANDSINGGSSGDNDTSTGLSGGLGNDTIDGGTGDDTLNGADGNDILFGGSDGTDDINGGNGNDRLDGGPGDYNDDYDGGAGPVDRVVYGILPGFTYTCTSQPVNVDMDNSADDDSCGNSSADDQNVRDSVESLTGSSLGDTVTGSCFANTISGMGGNDTLNGDPTCTSPTANGGDFLGGGTGNDTLDGDGTGTGAAGIDTATYTFASGNVCTSPPTGVNVTLDDVANDTDCVGGTDNVHKDIDKVYGSAQNDTINACRSTAGTACTGTGTFGLTHGVSLFGRPGNDTLIGTDNSDFLAGEGGTDTLDCKGGSDTTGSTTGDTVTNCNP